MCEACIAQLSTSTKAIEQPVLDPAALELQADGSAAVTARELSVTRFVGIVLCAFVLCVASIGLLIWLAVWLQPQIVALSG